VKRICSVRHAVRFIFRISLTIQSETFHFLGRETAFTAGISLILARLVLPSIVNPSFIESAKCLLRSKSVNGDSAATYLSAELSALDAFAATICVITPDGANPSSSETCSSMIQDGKELGDAILNVIRLDSADIHTAASSNCQTETQQAPGTQRTAAAASEAQWAGHFLFPGDSAMENSMAFDMEDLLWLDSVQ
jgi:hypothetical protein